MYPENPEGAQVIVDSMNMGYDIISDTARNGTHNLFHPKCSADPTRPQWRTVASWFLVTFTRTVWLSNNFHSFFYNNVRSSLWNDLKIFFHNFNFVLCFPLRASIQTRRIQSLKTTDSHNGHSRTKKNLTIPSWIRRQVSLIFIFL